MLLLRKVSKTFGSRQILSNINYAFSPGKLYVLVGNSGSGKSTLLHIIARFIPLTSGSIENRGRPISRENVTLILQQPYFYGAISLGENIFLATLFNRGFKKDRVLGLCATLQIEHLLKRRADVCSGGEKARANIVRGLVENKGIILVDEPTAHLDLVNSRLIINLLEKIASEKLVIVTTHQRYLFSEERTIFLSIHNGVLYEDF